jgi:hypothetical protein
VRATAPRGTTESGQRPSAFRAACARISRGPSSPSRPSATPSAISPINGRCQRFIEDGRLAIDNNRAENQLRVVAVGRKNWLFAGSFEGARRAALLYSLVQSCKLVDVSPFDYLKDVLLRIATHPQRLIGQLTPKGWADTFRRQPVA